MHPETLRTYTGLQDEEPNDRKIGKLCEYASRNPLRIPKVHLLCFLL